MDGWMRPGCSAGAQQKRSYLGKADEPEPTPGRRDGGAAPRGVRERRDGRYEDADDGPTVVGNARSQACSPWRLVGTVRSAPGAAVVARRIMLQRGTSFHDGRLFGPNAMRLIRGMRRLCCTRRQTI